MTKKELQKLLQKLNAQRGRISTTADGLRLNVTNESEREFEVSAASDLPIDMGFFIEVLSHEPGDVDLSFLGSGRAPLIDSHHRYADVSITGQPGTQIGVVRSARIEGGRTRTVLRLSSRSELDGVWQDLRDEVIGNVSIGYQRTSVSEVGETDDGRPIIRTKWRPYEVSLVPVGADESVGAGRAIVTTGVTMNREQIEAIARRYGLGQEWVEKHVRAQSADPDQVESDAQECVRQDAIRNAAARHNLGDDWINEQIESDATVEQINDAAERAAQPPRPQSETGRRQAGAAPSRVDEDSIRQQERSRVSAIRSLAQRHQLGDEWADGHINQGTEYDDVRLDALEQLAGRAPGASNTETRIVRDERDAFRAQGTSWLLLRGGYRAGDGERLDPGEFRGLRLIDIARRCLERAGVRTSGMMPMDIARRAIQHSTSDFSVLFEEALHKSLLAAFNRVPDTWRRWCAVGTVSDFRDHNRYRLSTFSDLKPLKENGEYESGTIDDATKERVSATTKGRMLNISRQMIVNDDMNALVGASQQLGRAAARTLEKDCYTTLLANPTLSDGVPVFHASHGNLVASGGVPSVTSIDSGRQLMGSQTDGGEILDIRPQIWLGPLSLGSTVRQINDSTTEPGQANPGVTNPVSGLFSDIVDTARLSGNPWYMFADPSDEPVFEVSFLEGEQSPVIEQDAPFETDGLRWKVRYDYGVHAVGYRGALKNNGA